MAASLSSTANPAHQPVATAAVGAAPKVATAASPPSQQPGAGAAQMFPEEGFTKADFDRHLEKLQRSIPKGGGFTVVVESPFVVIGDESSDKVHVESQGFRSRSTTKMYYTLSYCVGKEFQIIFCDF